MNATSNALCEACVRHELRWRLREPSSKNLLENGDKSVHTKQRTKLISTFFALQSTLLRLARSLNTTCVSACAKRTLPKVWRG